MLDDVDQGCDSSQPVMNVMFDIGDVLLKWKVDLIFRNMPDKKDQDGIMRHLVFHEDWLALDRGSMQLDIAITRAASRSGIARESIAQLMANIPSSLLPIPDSIAMLNEIDRDNHKLFCLSNLHEHVWNGIKDSSDLWDLFDGIVISCFTGSIKPEREIYEHVLKTFDIEANETVFIDDRSDNVAAAEAMGIHAIQFTNADDCRAKLWPMLEAPAL